MIAAPNCIDGKPGSYWYLSRTTSFGRYYPTRVTLDYGINTVIWTRVFKHAMIFPSEHSIQYFVSQRRWYGDKVEIVHIYRGSMKSIIQVNS